MKTGLESVKGALSAFLDSAAEDLDKTLENLKEGQFTHTRSQPRGVTQVINYTTVALLPVLSSLFEHIGQHQFGEDLIRMSVCLELPCPNRTVASGSHWVPQTGCALRCCSQSVPG